jgi:hypothetical protein
LSKKLKYLEPLDGLLDIAFAFSGKEDDPNIKIDRKHVLGSIAKYVFS